MQTVPWRRSLGQVGGLMYVQPRMRGYMRIAFVLAAGLVPGCSCGGDDAAEPDANPNGVNTLHCTFEDVPATSHAGSAVTAGPLMAGAAEVPIDVPVGTGQGGYTARADFLGAV